MAAAPGGTTTLSVANSLGTPVLFSEVTDALNPTASRIVLSARPPEWSVNNTSSANAQGTISKAAGAAGVAHVCTGFSAQLQGDATGNADVGIFNLRDGATGAGTVLYTLGLTLGAGALAKGTPVIVTGLNIVGSTATAMTAEFSGAGTTHTIQVVNMTGYDIS